MDTHRRTGRRRVSPRLQAGSRGHRVEAPGLALPLGPLTALGQEQEPGGTSCEAGSRGGLGQGPAAMSTGTAIVLAALIIGAVILYTQTQDRWPWKQIARTIVHIVMGIGVLIVAFVVLFMLLGDIHK